MAEGLDVRLGTVMTEISWASDGVTVACANGQSFQADAVVMTVSLGVLKVRHSHEHLCT